MQAPRPRRLLPFAALALVGIACSGSDAYVHFSEFTVEQALDEVDAAIVAQDADGVVRWLADDAKIMITVRVAGGAHTDNLDRDGYRAALAKGYASMSAYDYERTLEQVEFAEDGRSAVAESVVVERAVIDDWPIRSRTLERVTFAVRDAEVRVVAIDADSTILN